MVGLEKLRERAPFLDFLSVRAGEGRHSVHEYPAMFHYRLASWLISHLSKEGNRVYDPFCGSGVTLVEAIRQGREAVGTDINPLALLIADVRALNVEVEEVSRELEGLVRQWEFLKPDVPEVKNVDYWFKDYVIEELGKLRSFIKRVEDERLKKFFLVVFSKTVRSSSNNRKGEFKRFRLPEEKLKAFSPEPLSTFLETARDYAKALCAQPLKGRAKLYRLDVREKVPVGGVDLVITSPPYGDSRTTVAYGQFSSFSLEWMGELNPYGSAGLWLDREGLGGKKREIVEGLPSFYLYKALELIGQKDEKRAKEVFSFYYDLYKAAVNVCSALGESAKVCFVVGNRKVKGVELPTDLIVSEFFESLGLKTEKILVRRIGNKRMPSKNSPSNVKGQKSSTMVAESIVILSKE